MNAREDRRRVVRQGLCAGAALTFLLIATAEAQNALGSGSKLSKGGGGGGASGPLANPAARPSIASQARLNNAIVTGNVAGGKQFRGSVGYSGALDFRGNTGSDDLFSFQRDSFASGLAARGVRGIGGLQNQLASQTNLLPSTLANEVIVRRESSGVSGNDVQPAGRATSAPTPNVSASSFKQGGLRSLSRYTTDSAAGAVEFAPRGARRGEGTGGGIGVSALRGVYALPGVTEEAGRDAARAGVLPGSPAGATTAPNTPRPGSAGTGRVSNPAEPEPLSGKIEAESTYQRLLKQMEEGRRGDARPAPETTKPEEPAEAKPAWVRPPEEKEPVAPGGLPIPPQQEIPGQPRQPGQPGAEEAEGEGPDADAKELSFEERLARLRDELMTMDPTAAPKPRADEDAEDGEKKDESDAKSRADAAARQARDLLGGDRPMVTRFIDPTKDPGAFDRHMQSGQRALAENKWFNAEEAFTRAIAVRRDEPLAAVGRMHAQIGAGMFLSAAINARGILRQNPELAAVKYAPELLPRAERLAVVLESLREATERNDAYGRDAGLLLAYVGNQMENREDVERGLGAVERIEKHLDLPPDPLMAALRAVWLPGGN